MKLLDCTLRDGANVAGLGFDRELTESMIEGMLNCGIKIIEFGNAHGIGCNEPGSPMLDEDYLALYQQYRGKGEFGMFLQSKIADEEVVRLAANSGLDFLRVGNLAGNGRQSESAVRMVKAAGMKCRYALMRAYLIPPKELAEEAAFLESVGVDELTLMDSAGMMLPKTVSVYVEAVKKRVKIDVGFHGHNNLGMAAANAMAAMEAGADILDAGLMGMARSAGNCPTELLAALLQKQGKCLEIDLFQLLDYIEHDLEGRMEQFGFHNPLKPLDLVYGLSGCHSNVAPNLIAMAEKYRLPVYRYILEVSARDKKNPSQELMDEVAMLMSEV